MGLKLPPEHALAVEGQGFRFHQVFQARVGHRLPVDAVAVTPRPADDPGNHHHLAGFRLQRLRECRLPVDGKLVVARTRDGGKSFEVLRNGLPQENTCDTVQRHGLTVCDDGRHLAFGSTIGGVWTSDDQGDHWRMLPARLPMVHALCFA